MLVDVKPRPDPQMSSIVAAIALMNGNSPDYTRLAKGVYEIGHFSFDHTLGLDDFEDKYASVTRKKAAPVLDEDGQPVDDDGGYFGAYGVCDSYQQVIDLCAELDDSCPVAYCLSVTPIRKSEQSSEGGWRWHKWGSYIGTQKPQHEYIYDEKDIELVYCYHIYRIPAHLIDTSGQYEPKAIAS